MTDLKEVLYDWMGLNVTLFKMLNDLKDKKYITIMNAFTAMGDVAVFPYFLGAVLLIGSLAMIDRKLSGKVAFKPYACQWIAMFMVLFSTLAINQLSVAGMKNYFAYPRPYAALSSSDVRLLEAQDTTDTNKSFPSGHVARVTVFLLAVWPILYTNIRFVCLVIIAGVAWSRVALGVHFPADVVWSFFIALFQVVIIRMLVSKFFAKVVGQRIG